MRYESPNFELYSANRDGESRELLHNLELLRALFLDTFKLKERQPLPVTAYFFHREKDFHAYVSEGQRRTENLVGYYIGGPDRAIVTLSPTWDDESARYVIFDEYIHHLVHTCGAAPPIWYDVGVAELFSSINVTADKMELGKPLAGHVVCLRANHLLPLETLFDVDRVSSVYNNGMLTELFRAESWALMHYLYYGRTDLARDKVDVFMNYILTEGPHPDPARRRRLFQETIGMDYPQMQEELERYVLRGRYVWHSIVAPSVPPEKTYSVRKMPLGEIRERLAELDLRVNQSPLARLELLNDIGGAPADPRPLEVLGTDAWMQRDQGMMKQRWLGALEAGSQNAAIYWELARLEGAGLYEYFDVYFQLPEDRAQLLRRLLKRTMTSAPELAEAYELSAWVEATAARPDIAAINLVQGRFSTLPHKARTLLALALVRYRLDDSAGALALLREMGKLNPDRLVARRAELLRAQLEGRPHVSAAGVGEGRVPIITPAPMPDLPDPRR